MISKLLLVFADDRTQTEREREMNIAWLFDEGLLEGGQENKSE